MVGGGGAKGLPGSISLRIRQTFFAEKTVGCRPQAKEMFDPKMIFFLEQSFLGLEQELVKKASTCWESLIRFAISSIISY